MKIVNEARNSCASTLGLCWAGFALAYLAGVDKKVFDRKLFGVFPLKSLVPSISLMLAKNEIEVEGGKIEFLKFLSLFQG